MRTSRTWLRPAFALALLLLGLPAGGTAAIVVPGAPAGEAGASWLASGWDAPAVPETAASREAPESFAATAPGGPATIAVVDLDRAATCRDAALGVSASLYLSHCAFLC